MKYYINGRLIALVILLVTFSYLVAVTFCNIPATGIEHSKTIVGFLLGTVFGTLINYYWGNSKETISLDNKQGE